MCLKTSGTPLLLEILPPLFTVQKALDRLSSPPPPRDIALKPLTRRETDTARDIARKPR